MSGGFAKDLLDWQPDPVAVGLPLEATRAARRGARISKAVGQALKSCGRSRDSIAADMTTMLGAPVSAAMLDAYASEAKDGHQITVERLMALIEVTGCTGLLGFVAEPFGFAVVPARYADIIELHQIEDHLRLIEERRRQLKARARQDR